MSNHELHTAFADLATPLIADAVMREGVTERFASPAIRPLTDYRVAGRVLPVRHHGSVDVFLEVMQRATPGDILVIDNDARDDEACIGDLTALEARAHGIAGIIVWGRHRDTAELLEIDLPVFSTGAFSFGPRRLDERNPDSMTRANLGTAVATCDDVVFADRDGIVLVPMEACDRVLATAAEIHATERRQAHEIVAGETLSQQLQVADYVAKRAEDASYTFRKHLRSIGGEIEE